MKKVTMMTFISYALIYIVWGSTYFFIKMSVETIPPLLVVSARWLFGGLLFLIYYLLRYGYYALSLREIGLSFVMGLLLILIPNSLLTVAETRVDSYLAAVIGSTIPIAVAFFDRVLMGKKIAKITLLGMLTGIAGVGVLLYNGHSVTASLPREVMMLFGVLAVWSMGTSIGHRMNPRLNIVVYTGLQMLTTGIVSLALVAVTAPQQLHGAHAFSLRSVLALVYLITVGSVAFAAYNYLIRHEPAVRVTSYALVNPAIAVLLGLFFGNETPARFLAVGLPVILSGVALMLYGPSLVAFVKSRTRLSAAE